MSIPNGKFEHILLHDKATNREQAYKANRRLLLANKLLLLGILGVFIYIVITDSNYIREYSENIMTYVIGMTAWFWSALLLSYVVMWLPAYFFAKTVNQEILLTDTHLIYLAGSISLNYGGLVALHRPLIYLLGYDMAQKISRDQILSITIEKGRFLKPGLGLGNHIIIKHKDGEINTGTWLSQNEKQAIVDELKGWTK